MRTTLHSRTNRPLVLLLFILLTGCERPGDNPVILPQAPSSAPADPAQELAIRGVSTRPWLATGGDILVEVVMPSSQPPGSLRVSLNGQDISAGFMPGDEPGRLLGLVEGLQDGDNVLHATVANTSINASLTVTAYPVSGPIISGPHQQPFVCQTEQFQLANGDMLGPAMDDQCSVPTRIDYVYWSPEEGAFLPHDPTGQPVEVPEVTLPDGSVVPFIVRVETGTVNRAIYEIAMLHDPADPQPDPWSSPAGWNRKLVYTHGGGCRGGWYQQGNATGEVLRKGLLEMGYALTSATLNVFGQNCNDLLASETHIMVKERFVEHYGEPVYTIATGASGGSYQSHQTADNYPGVFDGIIVSSSFPDVTSATIFTLADARLLDHYFTRVNPEGFTIDQQRAIAGFGSWGSIANLARGAARLDPLYELDTPLEEQGGELSLPELEARRYHPDNPAGIRATVYDHTVNVYGLADDAPVAARPLDNGGVQYGLQALNDGLINVGQFLALNRDIGGFDRDMNHVPRRHLADAAAARAAIESGRILSGGAGLSATPVIDYRSYTDHREEGDIHMIVHQYSTRERLIKANGHADNHVMSIGGLWDFTADAPDLGNLFRQMDQWLMAIKGDDTTADPAQRVLRNKPRDLTDNCWDYSGEQRVNVREALAYDGSGRCAQLYPAYPTPRQVAGAPLANDVVSCHRKPPDPNDYRVTFSEEEWGMLFQIFPDGVCDWSLPDAHGASLQGTWLSFGPSPVNRLP